MTVRPDAFDSDLVIKAVTATTWKTLAPLVWTGSQGDRFVVPSAQVTDFATVPRFLVWLVLPYGAYTRAAVLHDWLLDCLADWQRASDAAGHAPQQPPPATSRDADGIFRRAMEDLGVWWPQRWLMWTAVRLASLFNHNRSYGRAFARDASAVIGICLLVGPFVAFGAIPVLIVLTLIRVLRALTGNRPVK